MLITNQFLVSILHLIFEGNVYLQCNAYIDFLHSVDWTTLWTNNSKQSLKISKQECKKSLCKI